MMESWFIEKLPSRPLHSALFKEYPNSHIQEQQGLTERLAANRAAQTEDKKNYSLVWIDGDSDG